MKINNLSLIIILSVLIAVILSAGILLIVTLSGSSDPADTTAETTATTTVKTTKAPITIDPSILNPPPITTAPPPVTTQLPVTTPKPAETTKTPETTTTPEPSTEPETGEPVTTAPESNEPTTSAPETQPETQPETTPETTVSDLKPISGTVNGENISSLRIFATYETESIDQEARTLTVKVTFFVESYGLQVGGRTTNYMMVNGQKVKNVHTNRINLPDGSPRTRTVLYEYVTTIEKPDDAPVTLELEYFWNCKLYYSGEYVDYLSVKLDLTA